jgi:Uncharacterized protein conserved in bacteria (DUF2066)
MNAKARAPFLAAILAALCAFWPGASSAQGRDNPYAVAGVQVDETAANSAAAQQQGFATAQRLGFERLVRRITLPDDLARLGPPQLDQAGLDRVVLSVDVEQERRSGTRYVGRLTVRYDPVGVRNLLRTAGFTVLDTRTAPVLVVPTATSATPANVAAAWRQAWDQGGFGGELAPLVVAPPTLGGAPDWSAARSAAESAAAGSAIYATLRAQGQTLTAGLTEVGPDGVRRDRGEVASRAAGDDDASVAAAVVDLAQQVSDRVQNEWKARVATGSGQRARVSASALYSSQRQWQQIKDGLEGAASTLISEIRIEAVGREGALVSFSFVGDRAQLAAELQRRGVSLQDSSSGPVLRATGR